MLRFTSDPDSEAVIVAIEDNQTSQIVLLLPLVKHREKGLSVISFADFGVADYNAPLIDPDHTFDPRATKALMQDIRKSLPSADLLKLEKIPELINKIKNPLCSLHDLQESTFCHYGYRDFWKLG